jgi:hypothetical protein
MRSGALDEVEREISAVNDVDGQTSAVNYQGRLGRERAMDEGRDAAWIPAVVDRTSRTGSAR